jgi:L,D-transpeptidase catalytic domain
MTPQPNMRLVQSGPIFNHGVGILGNTEYRIHGTNQPSTIGSLVSFGCIHLTNEDVEDLYKRVTVGSRVIVLPGANTATCNCGRGISQQQCDRLRKPAHQRRTRQ